LPAERKAVLFYAGTNDRIAPEAKAVLSGHELFEQGADDASVARCVALLTWPSRPKGDLFSRMKGLKMIQTLSAGVDALHFEAIPPGVEVYSNAGAFTHTVAEHAWGILLGVAKGIHLRNQKSTPRAMRGKTILIVGAGSIGSEVARLAKSLSMRTVGMSRSFRSPEVFDKMVPIDSLPDSIEEADAVVIALPLTKITRGLFGYDVLRRAKKEAVMVNIGRGEIVKEDDLIRWLSERPESRYATDVYWNVAGRESFSTKAWELPNFAGTLHVSGVPLGEDLAEVKLAAAENVKAYFESGSASNRVDLGEYV